MEKEKKMITVGKDIYSREVLLKTAYSFTDKAYIHLDQDKYNWIVSWKPRDGQEIDAGEFENELISQTLREELLKQTMDVRKIILARAFASTIMDDWQEDDSPEQRTATQIVPETEMNVAEDEKEAILRGWFDNQ